MARLFRAWSVMDNFMGQDQVIFNWFVIGRQAPVVPYEELIEDFDENRDEAGYDRMFVDEFLTREEVEELESYLLKNHNLEIQFEEISLPVKAGGLSYELLLISGDKNFYILADEDEYNLSVPILGHFTLDKQNPSSPLSYEELRIGVSFLEKVFDRLNISGFDHNVLFSILKEIYNENGYFVRKSTIIPAKNNRRI